MKLCALAGFPPMLAAFHGVSMGIGTGAEFGEKSMIAQILPWSYHNRFELGDL